MVYVAEWTDFAAKAEALVQAQPKRVCKRAFSTPSRLLLLTQTHLLGLQTRFTFKYRPSDAKLVLKVTDDVVVRRPDLVHACAP